MEPSITTSALHSEPRLGLELASRLGFRSVTLSAAQPGLRPRELDRSARRGLLAELRRLELECSSIDLFIPPEHFTSTETIERALDAVRGALDLATDLGARSLFLRLPSESLEDAMLEGFVKEMFANSVSRNPSTAKSISQPKTMRDNISPEAMQLNNHATVTLK